MGNILNERKYRVISSCIDSFINSLYSDTECGLNFSNAADKEILDLLIAAQSKALQISISFEDRVKENM